MAGESTLDNNPETSETNLETSADASVERQPTKAELQRQMEEARESISETVAEIRETVAHQYEEVREKLETARETVTEILDWREQFSKNPVAWGAGAVSVGILIGIGMMRTFDDASTAKGRRRRQTEVADIANTLLERLSHIGDAVLPNISASLREMFGIDLAEDLNPPSPPPKKLSARKGTKKRTTKKKSTKKAAANEKTADTEQ